MSMIRRSFTIQQRLDAVRRIRVDFGGNLSKASRDMNIDRKRLREWVNSEIDLSNADGKRSKRRLWKPGRHPREPELEQALYDWFCRQRQQKLVVNYRLIRIKVGLHKLGRK